MEYVQVTQVVSTVYINCLKQTHCHPDPEKDHVIGQEQNANEKAGS